MSGVAIQDGCVTGADLTRVVEDNDLGIERSSLFGRVVLRVGGNVTTTDILDGNVPIEKKILTLRKTTSPASENLLDVEADVVTRVTLLELLVVHFDGLDFSGHVAGSEGNNHASLDDTSLDTTDGHRTDTANLVDILERKTKGLVRGTNGGLDGINGVEQGLALDDTSLGLLGPTLVPCHAILYGQEKGAMKWNRICLLGRLLQHVVTVPARDGDERNSLGVVADFLDERGGFLNDFIVTVLAPLHKRSITASLYEEISCNIPWWYPSC